MLLHCFVIDSKLYSCLLKNGSTENNSNEFSSIRNNIPTEPPIVNRKVDGIRLLSRNQVCLKSLSGPFIVRIWHFDLNILAGNAQ